MNWKMTVALGALLIVAGVVYFTWHPEPDRVESSNAELLPDLRDTTVTRLELSPPGAVEIILEHAREGDQWVWKLVKPIQKLANDSLVQQIFIGLHKISRKGVKKPTDKDFDLHLYGLDAPKMIATFHSAGKKTILKLGNTSEITQMVWVQMEGDPNVYLADKDFLASLQKDVYQLRSKRLVSIENHRVDRVHLDFRYLRPEKDKDGKPVKRDGKNVLRAEYDHSEFYFRTKDDPKGWYLVMPFEERVQHEKVGQLIQNVSEFVAEDFEPASKLADLGLTEPEIKVSFFYNGSDKPITVLFSEFFTKKQKEGEKGKDRLIRYAMVEGSDEVAVLEETKFEPLPRERNDFRYLQQIDFGETQCDKIEVQTGLGEVALQRKTKKEQRQGAEIEIVYWEVLKPEKMEEEGLLKKEDADGFARSLFTLQLKDSKSWLGEQDPALFGLDKPEITITFHVQKPGGGTEPKTFTFAQKEGLDYAFMKKSWLKEVYAVPATYTRHARRLYLNFRLPKMFDVPRASLREFFFEWTDDRDGKPVRITYLVRLNDQTKKWEYADSEHKQMEVDQDKAADMLAMMNYIQAEAFISLQPPTPQFSRQLTPAPPSVPPAQLRIMWTENGAHERTLNLTENLSDKPQFSQYYAKFTDSPIVFQIKAEFIDSLKRGVIKRAKAENPPKQEHHDD